MDTNDAPVTDVEVAAIAAGLTKAQRAAVLATRPNKAGSHWLDTAASGTIRALYRLGLADDDQRPARLRPLGLRVAQHLKQENAK